MSGNATRTNAFGLTRSTLTNSIKTKYIVRSRHSELARNRFVPVNSSQARGMIKKDIIHDAGEPKRVDHEIMQRSTITMKSVHGSQIFRNTSPVTQDAL